MSDFEDEMDVDASGAKKAQGDGDITFASGNLSSGKGKRSAANLPVEAEDTLPWVEKYRPESLEDVSGHQDILQTIDRFVEQRRLPHLLLYGPPGTGKTSTILALARRIYGPKQARQMVLELNASDDRGIDVVREQIKTFASTRQIFGFAGGSGVGGASSTKDGADSAASSIANFKLIILDEADAMTNPAQMALRRIMEKYTANVRFCIIANYTHKLTPALLSRCTRFRFSPLKEPDIRRLVDKVIDAERVQITPEATDSLVSLAKGDMRRALNVLQACHASSTPLPVRGQPPPDPATIKRDTITNTTIYDCVAAPHPADIRTITDALLKTQDVTTCLKKITIIKQDKGLALADIISAVADELGKLEVPPQTRIAWLEGLAEIEHRLSAGGSETVQTGGLIGVVRTGADLMEHGGTGTGR